MTPSGSPAVFPKTFFHEATHLCRGGFQTRPASADTAREIFSGSSATALDYSRCKHECDLARGPRLLRQGGFETRPYMGSDRGQPDHSLLHCIGRGDENE